MSDSVTAVVDRIIDGETAVVLLESEAPGEHSEFSIDVTELPVEAHHDGAVISVVPEGESVTVVEYREEETRQRRESVQDRVDRLSTRLSDMDTNADADSEE